MSRRRFFAVSLATAGLVAVASPASGGDSGEPQVSVTAIDNVFTPPVVRIEPGQSVTWSNDGRSLHNVLADDGAWGSAKLDPGDAFQQTFERAGAYAFHCSFHGSPGVGMTGTVLVGDVALPGAAAGVSPGREPPPGGFAPTVRVPLDAPTVQSGVDRVQPGGMVLVAPGVYEESVVVTTPFITIRGEDRNRTILDGGFELDTGIHVIEADGVSLENLTARHFVLNGFQWSSVFGYRGSYLTAYANGDYGLFAYDSVWGQFDHSYASGHPDSGFYMGQCYPCHAVITEVLAEHNALGYSGTNAGGDLLIVSSEWRNNLAGIVPNTLDSERNPPQRATTIAGNYVHDNNSTTADTKDLTYPTYGIGILVTGGIDNKISGNLVLDQATYGIAILPNLDENLWVTSGNTVRGNVVEGSGLADLALGAPSAGDDCFVDNLARTSIPAAIELLYGCGGLGSRVGGGSLAPTLNAAIRFIDALDGEFPHGDWRKEPAPPDQEQMPRAADAPPIPAIAGQTVPQPIDTIRSARGWTGVAPTTRQEVQMLGVPLAQSWWGLLLSLYAYVLPFVLYAAWVSIALWDIVRRDADEVRRRVWWVLAVVLIPFVGPLIYFAFGRSPIPGRLRLALTAGALAGYLVIAATAVLLGG